MSSNDTNQSSRRGRQHERLFLAGAVIAVATWVVLILPSLPPKFYIGPGGHVADGLAMDWRPDALALLPAVLTLTLAVAAWITDRRDDNRLPWFGISIAAFFLTLATAMRWLLAASLWAVDLAWDNWTISVPVLLMAGFAAIAHTARPEAGVPE